MSVIDPSRPRRRPARKSPWRRAALLAAALLVVFLVGIALGKALDDSPAPATTQTVVRTLEPLPQQPAG